MEAENPTNRSQRHQTSARRLLDALSSRLFRRSSSGELADSPEIIRESFLTLCTNLRIHTNGEFRTLMITSAAPGEGKSLTAANLAVNLARRRMPVLLVDADLRRPVSHKIFRISNDMGLSDILEGGAEPGSVIQRTPEGPDVITSGTIPDDPSLLLGSDRMSELIAELTRKYQLTLFDTPPVLSATDAVLLAPLVDWSVLVLRAGSTVMEEARRAKAMLEEANGKIVGSILNSLDAQIALGYHKYADYYTRSSNKR